MMRKRSHLIPILTTNQTSSLRMLAWVELSLVRQTIQFLVSADRQI